MKSSKLLLKAMDVIALPENWTKLTFARDKNGYAVDQTSKNACQWCAVGAINLATKDSSFLATEKVKDYLRDYLKEFKGKTPMSFNDRYKTKHKDVMEMFTAATLLALSQGD